MRLTILASTIMLAAGCASNVSDTHQTPTLVSTNKAGKPVAVSASAPSSSMTSATKSTATKSTGGVDASVSAVVFGDGSSAETESAAAPAESAVKTSTPTTNTAASATLGSAFNSTPVFKGTAETAPTITAPATPVAPIETKTAPVVAKQSVEPVATPPGADLSKQVAPHYEYLRVTKLIPGRLTFNEKTRLFEFEVQGENSSLEENLSVLLTATAGGKLEYKVDKNHRFPNTFTISGQTVTHLIDQMVAPFKMPGQVWQNVHVNNLVVIDYSKRTASYAD